MFVGDYAGEGIEVLEEGSETELAGGVDVAVDEPWVASEGEDLTGEGKVKLRLGIGKKRVGTSLW